MVWAQSVDSYEGGQVRWQLVESDCGAQLTQHEISLIYPHSGQTCELFEIATGNGTTALVAHSIEPCLVLPEFEPRIWVRCASAGLRLGVRVVFPSAINPITGGRMTAILWGETYKDPGNWQAIKIGQMQKLFDSEVIELRHRYGPNIAIDDAFIDALVLNVYTGPGRYRFQVDDLSLKGHIALPAVGRPIPANWRESWVWRPELVNPDGRFWTAMNRPEVWLHYQRESLPWLKSLGIHGLIVARVPNEEQLRVIQEARLAVISPPPEYDVPLDAKTSQAIRGWLIGSAMMGHQIDQAKRQAARISQSGELKRPIFGEALEHFWQFSRVTDEVIIPAPDMMSAGSSREHRDWLKTQLDAVRERGNGFVAITTGPLPQWSQQYREAQKRIEPMPMGESVTGAQTTGLPAPMATTVPSVPRNPLGLRDQIIEATLAGARGIVLRSYEPLDAFSEEGRAQAASLRWSLNELGLWGPWIVAGQMVRPPSLNRPDYQANAWLLNNSYLMIVKSAASPAERLNQLGNPSPLVCGTSLASGTRQVFRVTHGEPALMETSSNNGSIQWTVQSPEEIEIFVVTENPNVNRFINQQLMQSRVPVAEDQLELAAYQINRASELIVARFPDQAGNVVRGQMATLARARQRLEGGLQAMRQNSPTQATRAALQSMRLSQSIFDDAAVILESSMVSPQSSPFAMTPAAFKYHWRLADACERSRWQTLPIAGSEFSSLDAMIEAGWTKQERLQELAELRVEWVPPSGNQAAPAIRMAAYQRAGEILPNGFEGATLRIRSAAAKVMPGQLVRIRAQARIRMNSPDPYSGLLVYDNQAGPALGQFVRGLAGEVKDIELYRFITANGELHLLAECRGQCDITLESISASVIEPARNEQNFPTTPVRSTQLEPLDLAPQR